MSDEKTFICSICKGTYDIEADENEVRAEYEQAFKRPFNPKDVAIVCDECYNTITNYFRMTR